LFHKDMLVKHLLYTKVNNFNNNLYLFNNQLFM